MKKTTLFATLAVLACFMALSCSKDSNSSNGNQTSIVGKWFSVNEISWSTPTGGSTQKDTTAAKTGEYEDFRTDSKVYSYSWHSGSYSYDTSNYVINGNSLILSYPNAGYPKADTFEIKILTSSQLSLYQKYTKNNIGYEEWLNYTK